MFLVRYPPRDQPRWFFLTSQQTFTVSERGEQQVRFLCSAGSGVWASCRLDPVLRLFDWSTGRPLQEVDFSVPVTKALGAEIASKETWMYNFNHDFKRNADGLSVSLGPGFLELSPLQITSLAVISSRLWVGTGGGALFSIPLSISRFHLAGLQRALPRIHSIISPLASEEVSIPYCSTGSAQLCYHGHRQAVRFIISAPGEILASQMLNINFPGVSLM